MTDSARLGTALAGRYAIVRELGAGGLVMPGGPGPSRPDRRGFIGAVRLGREQGSLFRLAVLTNCQSLFAKSADREP